MAQLHDKKIFAGGLNTDDNPDFLPIGDYTDALNIRTLSSDEQHGIGPAETLQGEIGVLIGVSAPFTYYGASIGGEFIYSGYEEVQIGTQVWMKKNWDAVYPGDKVYDDDEDNRAIYGALYTHEQITQPDFVPAGWRVPTVADIDVLLNFLGGEMIAGGILKEAGLMHWNDPNTGASDTYGFKALPGGKFDLLFDLLGLNGLLWLLDEGLEPPIALDETSVTTTSFYANWEAVTGATGYYLDVAIDADFNNILASFNNLDVGNVLTRFVSGLNASTTYYYRVRAYEEYGPSENSNVITVVTNAAIDIADYGALYNWYAASKTEAGDILYGALYNWYAVNTGMLASSGWAVPTRDQWIILVNYLGGYTIAGGKLKETGLTYWETNIAATNEVGFNGRGAGYRYDDGSFSDLKYMQVIWASSLYSPISAQQIQLMDGSGIVFCFETTTSSFTSGNSIRLVRDATEAEQLLDDGTACDDYVGNDGKVYPTVKIGTQVWLAANLAETKYNDDSDIPVVTDNATWAALTTGAMCYYDNDITNAITTEYQILPEGWHLPDTTEMLALIAELGGEAVSGGKLKETGDDYWADGNLDATNESGFNGRGSGARIFNGIYDALMQILALWTSEEVSSSNAYHHMICFSWNGASDGSATSISKKTGLGVRGIKDDDTDPGTMTDYDGNIYPTVKIGNQVWMTENLKVTHYRDGSEIPEVTDDDLWKELSTGAMCWYGNNTPQGVEFADGYILLDDGVTYIRKGIRNGYFVIDMALTGTGFAGTEDIDWVNLKNIKLEV